MALADSKFKDSFIAQDELDRLLDEARSAPLSPDDADDPATGSDDSIITQEDIDALLNLGRSAMDETPDSETKKDDDLVSQDDIDALLSSHKPSKKKKEPEQAPVFDGDDGLADLDLVTPEDIRKLLQSEAVGETDNDPESGLDSITDDDIKALISGTDLESESALAGDSDDGADLITQDDIDALLAGVSKEDKKKPGKAVDDPALMPDTGTVDNIINPADIDSLLSSTGESAEPSGAKADAAADDDTNLISQDDIDKLLMGKYQEPEEEEETTLIDQEDIDRLLSSARPFGEESPAKSHEPDKLISQEDIDRLLQEDDRDKEKTDDDLHDQVILEKPDEPEVEDRKPPKKQKEKKERKPLPKKKILVGLAVLCLLAAAGVGSFYVYKLKFSGAESGHETADSSTARTEGHGETASLATHGESGAETLETVTVTLNDFVAVAPPGARGSSYIALSLTFQIAETPENPVKDYEPFFRNMVYEAMNKALASQGETVVAEAELKAMIMDALNGALTQGSVSVLEFIDFETG